MQNRLYIVRQVLSNVCWARLRSRGAKVFGDARAEDLLIEILGPNQSKNFSSFVCSILRRLVQLHWCSCGWDVLCLVGGGLVKQ